MPIEYESVSAAARAFGRMPVDLAAELRPRIRAAAQLIATDAKARASYSSRIPAAISVAARLSQNGGAVVRVSAAKAPEARVLELGNIGSRSTTTFRHPVFGGATWVAEPMRPFLFPAVAAKKTEAMALIAEAVRNATRLP